MSKIEETIKINKHGGARPGAGPKKKPKTVAFYCKVNADLLIKIKEKHPDLNEKFKKWLTSLI